MTTIHDRIQLAIRPQLDQADALLDHYTDGLPPAAWEPLARQLAGPPRIDFEQVRKAWQAFRAMTAAAEAAAQNLDTITASVTVIETITTSVAVIETIECLDLTWPHE